MRRVCELIVDAQAKFVRVFFATYRPSPWVFGEANADMNRALCGPARTTTYAIICKDTENSGLIGFFGISKQVMVLSRGQEAYSCPPLASRNSDQDDEFNIHRLADLGERHCKTSLKGQPKAERNKRLTICR